MNIALISQEYPPETARGGIGTQTWNKARWLARRGHCVHVVSGAARRQTDTESREDAGVVVHRIVPPGVEFPVYEAAPYWIAYSWQVLRELNRLMRDVPFDVLDFAEYGGEGFAYLLDRTPWNWAPVAVQLHGPLSMFVDRIGWPERGSDLARVGTLMEETCMRKADALMACSANIADFTAQRHGVPRSAIDVVHCGVDSEAFQPGSVAGGAGRPAIAFVGNIAGNKGVLRVLDAVLRLRGRYPDLLLRIAGKEEGDTGRDIRARLRREGAESAVEFLGFVGRERIRDVYRAADLFCSPAVHEPGVANVYIDALACGVPVIAGTTGGAAEAVKHGITGLLVPPDSTEALVEALDRLLADPDARRRMGTAARAWVDEYFAMDRYIDRILAVYARARICSEAKKRAAAETAGC